MSAIGNGTLKADMASKYHLMTAKRTGCVKTIMIIFTQPANFPDNLQPNDSSEIYFRFVARLG
jgi:hypothetical protein